jgi:hypothetical protein
MSTQEFQLSVFLEALHGLSPSSLTAEQLIRAISAVKFAAPRWQDEFRLREASEMRRREREMAEAA